MTIPVMVEITNDFVAGIVFIVCSRLKARATVKSAVPMNKARGILVFIFIFKVGRL